MREIQDMKDKVITLMMNVEADTLIPTHTQVIADKLVDTFVEWRKNFKLHGKDKTSIYLHGKHVGIEALMLEIYDITMIDIIDEVNAFIAAIEIEEKQC